MRIILRHSAVHVILRTVSHLEKSEVCALTSVPCFSASEDWIYGIEIEKPNTTETTPHSPLGLVGSTLKNTEIILFFSEFIGDKTKDSLSPNFHPISPFPPFSCYCSDTWGWVYIYLRSYWWNPTPKEGLPAKVKTFRVMQSSTESHCCLAYMPYGKVLTYLRTGIMPSKQMGKSVVSQETMFVHQAWMTRAWFSAENI